MNELAFFEDYCSHFNNQDLQALGDCFSGPLSIYLPDGDNHMFQSRQEMDENNQRLFDLYNELGFHKADFNLLSIINLAKRQFLCQLRWIFMDKRSKVLTTFETSYLLSGEKGNYSITAVFVKDELEKLDALKAQ